jgi:hypothetical protein
MSAFARKRARVREQLRQRDGDNCWYCGQPLSFELEGSARKFASIEHLIDLKYGGTNKLGNLVLAHAKCNRKINEASSIGHKFRHRQKRHSYYALTCGVGIPPGFLLSECLVSADVAFLRDLDYWVAVQRNETELLIGA